jgi:hypothetical protein
MRDSATAANRFHAASRPDASAATTDFLMAGPPFVKSRGRLASAARARENGGATSRRRSRLRDPPVGDGW